MVRPTGFEPMTYSSGGYRSIQLSYGRTPRDANDDAYKKELGWAMGLEPTATEATTLCSTS